MKEPENEAAACVQGENTALFLRFREIFLRLAGENLREGVLVGFSGGGDSCALLCLLAALRDSGEQPFPLHAVHIHHGLRGESADDDEKFCQTFCEERQIGYTAVRGDVRALAAGWHTGLEDAGRRFRYDCFEKLRRERGLCYIVTAHQGDDQIETVLLHLLRGCGIDGLRGIPEKTPLPECGVLLRPLLSFSGEQLRAFCRIEKIPFREDESNTDCSFARNALRQRVIPLLKEMNPGLSSSVGRLTALAASDSAFLQEETKRAMSLPEEAWRQLPDALLSRLLQRRFSEANGLFWGEDLSRKTDAPLFSNLNPNPLPYEALVRLMTLFRGGENFKLSLPGGLTAWQQDGRLYFCPDRREMAAVSPLQLQLGDNPLPGFPGRLFLSADHGGLEGEDAPSNRKFYEKDEKIYKILIKIPLGFDKIEKSLPLFCRAPAKGDKYRTGGRERPVRELLRTAGIPLPLRGCFPLLCDEEGILWIPGFPLREGSDGGKAGTVLRAELRLFGNDRRNL